MQMKFTKMHGAGNDFVVIDLISQRLSIQAKQVRKIADRHLGVGCDQVLLVEAPSRPDVDFGYRIFNADGSEVEHCGNGARCFARFVASKRLSYKSEITVETLSGISTLKLVDSKNVAVDMGIPVLDPQAIPFQAPERGDFYPLEVAQATLEVGAVSMGNPHVVLQVNDVQHCDFERLGPLLEANSAFPKKANAGFLQVISRSEVALRVYERGVGETLACGTGACAAVVYGILRNWLDHSVKVRLPGGELKIKWQGEGHSVRMTGPTEIVFEGSIRL